MLIDKLLKWVENRNMTNALAVFELNSGAKKKELDQAYQTLLNRYDTQNRGQLYECAKTAIDTAYQYLAERLECEHPLMVVNHKDRDDWDRISKELYELKKILEREAHKQKTGHNQDDLHSKPPRLQSKKWLYAAVIAVTLCILIVTVILVSQYTKSSKTESSGADLQIGQHKYYFYQIDISWTKAQEQCKIVGGHLAVFDQDGEYESVVSYIESQYYLNQLNFYIGGSRTSDGKDYRWVDAEGNSFGTSLLNASYKSYWGNGEPAFADGETKMILGRDTVNHTDNWYWYEIPDNAVSQYSGKLGYILEYD